MGSEAAGLSLTWRVTNDLGAAIASGAYPPGSVLPNESELSVQTGTGRSSIREAVKILESKGLVEARPKRGTAVLPVQKWNLYDRNVQLWLRASPPSPELLMELIEVRRAFEPVAASLAATRIRENDIAALRDAYRRMQEAQHGRDDPYEADLAFHTAILRASGNRFFGALVSLIGTALLLSFRVTNAARRDKVGDLRAHRLVLKSIERKDPRAAGGAMQELLDDVSRVINQMQKNRNRRHG